MTKPGRQTVSTLMLLALAWAGLARAEAASSSRLAFEHLTVDDGLPENTVRAILQDRTGFLWFGTHNGVVRFDGLEMVDTWHDGADSAAAPRFFVSSLLEDRDGVIWIGTVLTGIWRLDPRAERCTQVIPSPGPPGGGRGQHDPDLCLDGDGKLWVAWNGYGLSCIDPRNLAVTWLQHDAADPASLPTDRLSAVLVDHDGRLWVGTEGEGVLVREPGAASFRQLRHDPANPASLSDDLVTRLHQTPDGVVWVLTFHGLSRWLPGTQSFRRYLPAGREHLEQADYFVDATASADGGLWLGSAVGLYHFDQATGAFDLHAHDPDDPRSPAKGPVISVCRDRSGIVWAGAWHAGLNKLDPAAQKFARFAHDPRDAGSLDDDVVMAVLEDASGTLWVGTGSMSTGGSRGGLNRLDAAGRFTHLSFPTDQVRTVQSLAEDRQGNLWLGTNLGLWRLDRARARPVRAHHDPAHAAGIGDAAVRCLLADRQGNLWVSSFRHGLYRIDPAGQVVHYQHDPADPGSLAQDQIICLAEDAAGNLWIGTDSRGLDLLRPGARDFVHAFDPRAGLSSMIDIHADANGRVWLGTYGGLIQYDAARGVVAAFTTSEGLPHNVVSAILEDDAGRLWLSTGRGVAQLDLTRGSVRAYDTRDGLPSNEMGFARCRRRDGALVLGGQDGLVQFRPDRLVEDPFQPPVVLTELRLADQPVRPGPGSPLASGVPFASTLRLPYDRNDVTLGFAALHFSHPERNRYRCRLAPYDDDWREIGTRRSASYTNLDPGDYVFEVQGTNGDGIWSDRTARLAITIRPPWWRTTWAYVLYTVLAAAFVAAVYRQIVQRERMRTALEVERAEASQMHELDELKSRFFANITHEFRTPLTLLQGPLQRLQENPASGDPALFAIMGRNARRLGQLIDQLLDLSRLDARRLPLRWAQDDVVAYLRTLAASFSSLAGSRAVAFHTSLPDEPLPCWFDGDLLEKVVGNLLSNACKFTPDGGEVTLAVAVAAEVAALPVPATEPASSGPRTARARRLTIAVTNSGTYIAPSERERIFDRFSQLAGGRAAGGSGIGLALVRELVAWQGGSVVVDSDEARGTSFTVTWPVFLDAPVDLATEAPRESAATGLVDEPAAASDAVVHAAAGDERPLVLIVEDHPDLREYLRRELQDDYRLLMAGDGDEGLATALAEVPDLVLTDVMMPGKDGFELCGLLKADDLTSHVPVVLLTARAAAESRRTGLRQGADVYLAKPFDPEELRLQIANLISQRRRLAAKYAQRVVSLAPEAMPVTSADERFLQRVRRIIEAHLDDEDFEVEVFSREVGLSRSQLHRKLKALTGQSAGEVIRAHRLQRAADLLAGGFGNVTEVTYAVGFKSLSHFAKCFRQQYGVSPSEYPQKPQT
jgi:signal transduction histidine kinase/ligand-binding sensor domain-containing protein/DNA-binding response OmpR family regulator